MREGKGREEGRTQIRQCQVEQFLSRPVYSRDSSVSAGGNRARTDIQTKSGPARCLH